MGCFDSYCCDSRRVLIAVTGPCEGTGHRGKLRVDVEDRENVERVRKNGHGEVSEERFIPKSPRSFAPLCLSGPCRPSLRRSRPLVASGCRCTAQTPNGQVREGDGPHGLGHPPPRRPPPAVQPGASARHMGTVTLTVIGLARVLRILGPEPEAALERSCCALCCYVCFALLRWCPRGFLSDFPRPQPCDSAALPLPALVSVWPRLEPFLLGVLPAAPPAKFSMHYLRKMAAYVRARTREGCFPRLHWPLWRHIACGKLQLPEDTAWLYFETCDLLSQRPPEERLEWAEAVSQCGSVEELDKLRYKVGRGP
ncbi:TBCC1 protein, partial [Atractosteus spatula]|nr:TBCC1 protein [Atractosteus spatula]